MTRPITEEDLHAHIDGVLTGDRRAEVETYLGQNPDVAARYAAFAQQRAAMRAALAPIATEALPPQLNFARLVEQRRAVRTMRMRAAAAIAIFFAGGLGGWILRSTSVEDTVGIAALAREASYSYSVFGADRTRPVEIAAEDSTTLASWVQDRLSRPVSIPDLSSSGYELMGGRLVATQNGPAGMAIYAHANGSRIALFMRPMKRDRDARMAEHRAEDVGGYVWADDGMGFGLVGEEAVASSLHSVADEVRRQVRARS